MSWLWHMTYWQGRLFETAVTLAVTAICFAGFGIYWLIKRRRK